MLANPKATLTTAAVHSAFHRQYDKQPARVMCKRQHNGESVSSGLL